MRAEADGAIAVAKASSRARGLAEDRSGQAPRSRRASRSRRRRARSRCRGLQRGRHRAADSGAARRALPGVEEVQQSAIGAQPMPSSVLATWQRPRATAPAPRRRAASRARGAERRAGTPQRRQREAAGLSAKAPRRGQGRLQRRQVGKRIVAGGDLTTLTGVFNFLQSAGVTDEAEARRLTTLEFSDGRGTSVPAEPWPAALWRRHPVHGVAETAEQFTFSAAALERARTAQPRRPRRPLYGRPVTQTHQRIRHHANDRLSKPLGDNYM